MPATVQYRGANNETTEELVDQVACASVNAGSSIVRPLSIAPDDWSIGALFFRCAIYPASVFQAGNIAHFSFYYGLCAGSAKRVGTAGDVFAGGMFDDVTMTGMTDAGTVPPARNYSFNGNNFSVVRLSGVNSGGGGLANVQVPLNDVAWAASPKFGDSWMPVYVIFLKGDPNITIVRLTGYAGQINVPRGVFRGAAQDYFSSSATANSMLKWLTARLGAGTWLSNGNAAIAMLPALQGALTHLNFFWNNTTESVSSRMLIRDFTFTKWK